MIEFVIRHLSSIFYISGSTCFIIGTVIGALRAG